MSAAGARLTLAPDTLLQLGYGRVAHREGGFESWKETGHPVEGATPPEQVPSRQKYRHVPQHRTDRHRRD